MNLEKKDLYSCTPTSVYFVEVIHIYSRDCPFSSPFPGKYFIFGNLRSKATQVVILYTGYCTKPILKTFKVIELPGKVIRIPHITQPLRPVSSDKVINYVFSFPIIEKTEGIYKYHFEIWQDELQCLRRVEVLLVLTDRLPPTKVFKEPNFGVLELLTSIGVKGVGNIVNVLRGKKLKIVASAVLNGLDCLVPGARYFVRYVDAKTGLEILRLEPLCPGTTVEKEIKFDEVGVHIIYPELWKKYPWDKDFWFAGYGFKGTVIPIVAPPFPISTILIVNVLEKPTPPTPPTKPKPSIPPAKFNVVKFEVLTSLLTGFTLIGSGLIKKGKRKLF